MLESENQKRNGVQFGMAVVCALFSIMRCARGEVAVWPLRIVSCVRLWRGGGGRGGVA